jgi:hypothetical protein
MELGQGVALRFHVPCSGSSDEVTDLTLALQTWLVGGEL